MIEEGSGAAGTRWRWAVVVFVVAMLTYPVLRWMQRSSGDAAGTQTAAAASELQASFEHYRAGRYQEAVAAAKAALAADPTSPDAYNNLAVSYLGLRMYDEAIQAAQDAIRLKPDYQLAKNNLAWIQQEKIKATSEPVQPGPSSPADPLLTQSLQHYQAGRFRECFDTAKQAAALDPHSAQAFNNIGICAGNLKLWDEALRNTQEAIRLAPNFQLARNNLAWVQQQMVLLQKERAGTAR